MLHSQGISPPNVFIHSLQRGNLTHDLIHLCDVCGMSAALRDTCCIFWPQVNTQSEGCWPAAEQTRGGGRGEGGGRRGEVADAEPANLSFNLQPHIGHFKDRRSLPARDPRARKNVSDFETRRSCGCSTCTDPLEGSDRPDGPIGLPKIRGALTAHQALLSSGPAAQLAVRRL